MPAHDRPHAGSAGSPPRFDDSQPPPGTLVSAYMTQPAMTVSADTPSGVALSMMRTYGVHHLLVTNHGRVVAMLSDRDLARTVSPRAGTLVARRDDDATLRHPVYHAASYGLVTIRHDATIEEAAALILERGISALPVTDDAGGVAGIITTRDLLHGLLSCALPATDGAR
jgi:acetoin utilization protein AcuB